ncbi:MAG: DUF1295 domain-containing protein [Oleispira sp.]|nr:DUF1295 domain-containing protein [Oleispira sp.]MBL4881106.1 DUF1295 domain-containing protein [Oleispira sp.]
MSQRLVDGDIFQRKWITDKAYISGLAGVGMLLILACFYHSYHVFETGIFIGVPIQGRTATTAFALLTISLTMVLVELLRLWHYDKAEFIRYSPLWLKGHYFQLILAAGKKYLLNLLLLIIAGSYYYCINEYGFNTQATYYQPWFQLFKILCWLYLFLGFPYQLITLAFKHHTKMDTADLLAKAVVLLSLNACGKASGNARFSLANKKIVLSYLVKLFFAPIMTVFFFDNFYHLVSNINYIQTGLITEIVAGNYSHQKLNRDLTNIVPTIIFSIDVSIAWCGYIVSSRWLDNHTVSADPTLFGWAVCLLSYPPFRTIPGWFFSTPDEKMYLQLPDQTLVTVLAVLMMISYFLYMLPTIFFGVRFSNLTNRGIIRTGPFAYVRHPAYAAKNIAWWCVGLPVAIYSGLNYGFVSMLLMLIGLVFMSAIYYLRAITEEKHLAIDPYYQAYCKEVRYRFIPHLI